MWANSTLLKMTNLQQTAKMTIPSQNMYFNSLKKKLQQVNLIKNLRRLPLPRKKKNWTSELECLQCHEIESANNQGRISCIYCMLCTAVLHSPDLASGVNWKDSICWVTKQWWPQNVFRQVQEEWNNSTVCGADKLHIRHTYSERPLRQTFSPICSARENWW